MIVYHRNASDTYCLDTLGATLLEALVDSPSNEHELCQRLLDQFLVEDPNMLESSVREKLHELKNLDFIALEAD